MIISILELLPTLIVTSPSTSLCLFCIGVKRMKKLHKDGFSESLGYESFDACEPCLLGKMTKTPFSGTMERATDLLEIIHTDVCDPMSATQTPNNTYLGSTLIPKV